MIEKVISGGQTGVDPAGLDAAIELGIPYGGKVPKGRLSEDGGVPMKYDLIELDSDRYPVRTRANVMDADGTLLLCSKEQFVRSRGTALTVAFAHQYERPWWMADPGKSHHVARVVAWINEHHIKVLNVAGPRESKCPGIHDLSVGFLKSVLQAL